MKTSTKLVTIFAALAALSTQGALAANSKKPLNLSLSADWNASGAGVYSTTSAQGTVDDFKDFNDFGNKVKVKDLKLDLDVTVKAFEKEIKARLGLEENSNDLSINTSDLKSKVRELSVGMSPIDGAIVMFGRMDIPFGGDVSRRAIDRNNAAHRALEQNERTVQAVIALDPQSGLLAKLGDIPWMDVKSIEITKFASGSNPNDLKFGNTLDSEAIRAIAQIGKVVTQASYMRVQGIERQMSVSAETGLETSITGPFTVYGEALAIRDSALNGNVDLYTLGAEKRMNYISSLLKRDSSAYVEGTRVYNKDSKTASNEGAAGLKVQATSRMEVAAEYSTHAPGSQGVIAAAKDPTVSVQVAFKRANKDTKTTLFPYSSAKKSQQDAAVDAMRAK